MRAKFIAYFGLLAFVLALAPAPALALGAARLLASLLFGARATDAPTI
jgi:hypothetical protein